MFVSDNPEHLGCAGWFFFPKYVFTHFDDNSPQKCGLFCNSLDYKYFGLKNGKGCRCGHYAKRGEKTYSSTPEDCKIKCPGDQSKTCGGNLGAGRSDVYKFNIAYLPKDQVDVAKDNTDAKEEGKDTMAEQK